MTITRDEIDRRFGTHEVNAGQAARILDIRVAFANLATLVVDTVPEGREQSMAVTHLEEGSFSAIAGIARDLDV